MFIDEILYTTVREDIEEFNATRGRRKELRPMFVRPSELVGRWQKYGRILEIEDWLAPELPDTIRKMAHAVVRTMLRRKPRPTHVHLDILVTQTPMQLLFRLMIPKRTIQ